MVDVQWTMIAAMDQGRGIGLHGRLPWSFPEDLKHFKDVTMGQVVLVGVKTHSNMPALKGRHLIVLDDALGVVKTVQRAYRLAREVGAHTVFLAGGAASYNKYHHLCDSAIITTIPGYHACDTFFNLSWLGGMDAYQTTTARGLHIDYYRSKRGSEFHASDPAATTGSTRGSRPERAGVSFDRLLGR